MRDGDPERDWRTFQQEMRERQRNIVFPDTVRNARYLYQALWHGSPTATWVQRMGAAALAVLWVGSGVGLVAISHDNGSFLGIMEGLLGTALGAKVLHSAFRHRKQ